jgi:hypothetical protein
MHVLARLLGLAVRGLDEVRHSGSQSAIVRVVWKRTRNYYYRVHDRNYEQ